MAIDQKVLAERSVNVKPGQIFIYGKVRFVEKFQSKDKKTWYRTRILMQGADEFSFPRPYDILTDSDIGKVGEVLSGVSDSSTFAADWETKPTEENGGVIATVRQIQLTCYGFTPI